MKKVSKLLALVLVLMFLFQTVGMVASAGYKTITPSEMQKSVVQIWTDYVYTSKNYGLKLKGFNAGTGFAIGEVGEPVQYIATCYHMVEERDGMWYVVYEGSKLAYAEPVDDGVAPRKWTEYGMTCVIDYFEIRATPRAVFYESTGDQVSLSVRTSDYERDVAICQLALREPTTKIEARPLLWRSDDATEVGDTVYAIGYPGNADFANSEGRGDYSDSTVTKGVISKVQLTSGLRNAKQQFYTFMIDANITGGNSGGPLFTEKGSIIGVNSFGVESDYSLNAPANYAIAIEEVIKLAEANRIKVDVIESEEYPVYDDPNQPVTEAATEAQTTEKKDSNALLIGIIIGAIVLVALIVVVVILLMKKKDGGSKGQPAPVYQPPVQNPNYNYPNNMNNPANNMRQPVTVPGAPVAPVGGTGAGPTIYIPNEEKLCIVCVSGPLEGQKFAIEEKATIGRDTANCDIVFAANQPGVSNIHCEVFRNGNALSVKDCKSTYGTFLKNGTKLTPEVPVVLQNGDQFMVGDKNIIFEARY